MGCSIYGSRLRLRLSSHTAGICNAISVSSLHVAKRTVPRYYITRDHVTNVHERTKSHNQRTNSSWCMWCKGKHIVKRNIARAEAVDPLAERLVTFENVALFFSGILSSICNMATYTTVIYNVKKRLWKMNASSLPLGRARYNKILCSSCSWNLLRKATTALTR